MCVRQMILLIKMITLSLYATGIIHSHFTSNRDSYIKESQKNICIFCNEIFVLIILLLLLILLSIYHARLNKKAVLKRSLSSHRIVNYVSFQLSDSLF